MSGSNDTGAMPARPEAQAVKRVGIALQQLYAALRLYYSAQGRGTIESGFARLVDEAVADRLITASSRTLVVDCLAVWCAGDSGGSDLSVDGALDAAQQLGALSKRIEELVPIGMMPGVLKPMVIDSWAPLASGLEDIASSGLPLVVRGEDGYCLLLVAADVGMWLAQGQDRPSLAQTTVGQVAGLSGEGWTAVDERVATGQVVDMLGSDVSEVLTVLVFANEDYSGDPTGMVTSRVVSGWHRDDERRRKDAASLLDKEAGDLANGIDAGAGRVMAPIEELALELGVNRPFAHGEHEVDLAIVTATAGSMRGISARELWQTLRGRRDLAVERRGLADLPVFGSVPDIEQPQLAVHLAYLVARGVLKRHPRDGRYMLGKQPVCAVTSDHPYDAIESLLGEKGGAGNVD